MLHDVDPMIIQALNKLREASRMLEHAGEWARLVEHSSEPELDGRIVAEAFDLNRKTTSLLLDYLFEQGALPEYYNSNDEETLWNRTEK